jgi:hypothetical protein
MIGLATPSVIGEFVTDHDKGRKWTRFAILLTAMAEEGLWAHRVKQDNAEREGAGRAVVPFNLRPISIPATRAHNP